MIEEKRTAAPVVAVTAVAESEPSVTSDTKVMGWTRAHTHLTGFNITLIDKPKAKDI